MFFIQFFIFIRLVDITFHFQLEPICNELERLYSEYLRKKYFFNEIKLIAQFPTPYIN